MFAFSSAPARCLVAGVLLLSCTPGRAADTDPLVHLRALQDIAAANGGNRASGTAGYERSVEYVADQLSRAGYAVRTEEFTYPYNEERSPPRLAVGATPAPTGEVRSFTYSGGGDVTAPLRAVDLNLSTDGSVPPSTSACEAEDFAGFERGSIALVRRGTCPFFVKVQNAITAGAAGVIAMNEGTAGQTESFSASLGRPTAIPVVGVGYAFGRELAEKAARGEAAHLAVDIETVTVSTKNVIAEIPSPNDRRPVVMIGAHLDSVRDGPGINDNGSGVSAVLVAAARLSDTARSGPSRLRFGFWAAEEVGLLGSRHHVESLSEQERKEIAVYINLDMVGSPNFARIVLADADLTGAPATSSRAMLDYFAGRSLAAERRAPGPLALYSTDMASFKRRGVPVVGLYTGSAELKRPDEVAGAGGRAGEPYDTCYHRSCDTTDNVNVATLSDMAEALVHTARALTTAPVQ